jgi:hypothetical protein
MRLLDLASHRKNINATDAFRLTIVYNIDCVVEEVSWNNSGINLQYLFRRKLIIKTKEGHLSDHLF